MSGLNSGMLVRSVLWESRGASGRLLFFTLCLAIGVSAVVGVSGLVSSIEEAVREQSRELLGADLSARSRRTLPAELEAALPEDAKLTRVITLPTMASLSQGLEGAGTIGVGSSRLVELKVVDGEFPLFGDLPLVEIGKSGSEVPPTLARLLEPDSLVLAAELAREWQLLDGGEVSLGGVAFRVAGIVEPSAERLEFSFDLGPRAFLSKEAFERTSLGGFGNRVTHERLVLLPGANEARVDRLAEELRAAVPDASYVRIETHTQAQPAVRRSLDRVERFLGLVALLSLVLGGAGVALLVKTWLAGRVQQVATMRCLGMRPREVLWLWLANVLVLGFMGSLLGALMGSFLPLVVPLAAPHFVPFSAVQIFRPGAILRGLLLGVPLALLFSLPPLSAIWRVSPALVIRSGAEPLSVPRSVRLGTLGALGLGLFGAAWLQARDLRLALAFTGGIAACALLLSIGAASLRLLARRVPRGRLSPHLAHGLAALGRKDGGASGAIVALGLGVLVVLTMILVERGLRSELESALPDAAPSVFLVDVQPDQWQGLQAALATENASNIDSVPVVMARLSEVDDTGVAKLSETKAREDRWVFSREQRLTWLQELPEDNVITSGALWSEPEELEVSLEEEFAERIGAQVGSRLIFDLQGVPIELLVTSLRSVDWRSFAINFFIVVEPGVLEEAPHFRIAAARFQNSDEESALQDRVAALFPNISVVRLRPILDKVSSVLQKLALGVRILGGFTVLSGLAILAGAVASTALRRRREAALLKVLGSKKAQIRCLFATEYALVGAVAGGLGASGAALLAHVFLTQQLELDAPESLVPVLLAIVASAVLSTLCGIAASRRALDAPALEGLRGL